MYQIKPYSSEFLVVPAKIIYKLPSYHNLQQEIVFAEDNNNFSSIENGCLKKNIPGNSPSGKVKDCIDENANQEIIKILLSISKRLDKFIVEKKSTKNMRSTIDESTCGREIDEPMNNNNVVQTNSVVEITKKDAKERKEKCQIAKNFAENLTPVTNKIVEGNEFAAYSVQPKPEFNLKSLCANSPDLIHAVVQPTVTIFPIHDYGAEIIRNHYHGQNICLTLRNKDQPWIQILAKIGWKRGVRIYTEGNDKNCLTRHLNIAAEFGTTEIRLNVGDVEIYGELAIWKFIGSLLGIYSTEDTIVSTKIDNWLLKAHLIDNFDSFSRNLNSILGVNDFLSSKHAICLADLIIRSFFISQQTGQLLLWQEAKTASNVQLWLKRIDDSLAIYN